MEGTQVFRVDIEAAAGPPEGLRVRGYRSQYHEEGLLELFTQAFDGWPKHELTVPPLEHLRWKMANAASGRDAPLIAEIDGRIVGASCGCPLTVQVEGRECTALYGLEGAVLPEYQQRGVMAELRRTTATGRRKAPSRFDFYVGAQSGHPAMQRLRQRVRNPRERHVHTLDVLSARTRARAPADDISVRRVEQFDVRIDGFWRAAAEPFSLLVARGQDYLNWRYCDPRAGRFTALLAEARGELLGYAVVRESHGKGDLVDLLVLPERLDALIALVRESMAQLHERGIDSVTCWSARGHLYSATLAELGFRKKRRVVHAVFYPIRFSDDDLAFLRAERPVIHITSGDTDLV